MKEIESEDPDTRAQTLIRKMEWNARPSGDGSNYAVEFCPFCERGGFKFFIAVGDEKDGLYNCVLCAEDTVVQPVLLITHSDEELESTAFTKRAELHGVVATVPTRSGVPLHLTDEGLRSSIWVLGFNFLHLSPFMNHYAYDPNHPCTTSSAVNRFS